MQDLDIGEFRNALGSFATGVTIVTTTGRGGGPVGVTASSFNSVSLDPPLVLWSLAKTSQSYADFCESHHFAVHILAADQDGLSNRFAQSGADKFRGIAWEHSPAGSPLLDHYAALFECKTRHLYEGGDHVIIVGEVVAYERQSHPPLLFHSGRYAEAREKSPPHLRHQTNIELDNAESENIGSENIGEPSIATLLHDANKALGNNLNQQAQIFESFTREEMDNAKVFLRKLIDEASS